MTMDGVTLHKIVEELSSLTGAKIEKIQQPASDEIVLRLHTLSGKKQLVLSANASDCRIHLTDIKRDNPKTAPNFCMFLRKYIGNGRIEGFSQCGMDRVVSISISAKDEMGVVVWYDLVVEIMSKHSNIMLLNVDGKIMESLKHVSFDVSRVRQVLPGMKYSFPPSEKLDPLTADISDMARRLTEGPVSHAVCDSLQGISHQTAEDILQKKYSGKAPQFTNEAEARSLASFIAEYLKQNLAFSRPCLQKNGAGLPVFYSVVPYAAYSEAGRIYYKTMNEAVDGYYALRREISAMNAGKNKLLSAIKKNRARISKKLKIQNETLASAQNIEKYRIYGELITANIYAIKRGMKSAELLNYYTNEPVVVPLDEKLSPSANATKYFKRVGKLKNALIVAKKQSVLYSDELKYLDDLEYCTNSAATPEDLEEVRLDLEKYGYLPAGHQDKVKRSDPLSSPYQFTSSDGFPILAGRNSRGNDALTMRVAGKDDLWFHGRNIPGSHVILFTKGKQPSETAIFEAATIAATLSKAKSSGKTDIDYAPRSHVWKANGARPGMVLYDGHTTITVKPDPELTERLRSGI